MKKHLAIFTPSLARLILEGKKTIESRFSKAKIVPFGQISPGDLVYIKPVGKDIIGQFKVKKVISFEGLEESDFREIREIWGKEIAAPESFWADKKDSKYGTLIFIGEVDTLMTSPVTFKKRDQRSWVIF